MTRLVHRLRTPVRVGVVGRPGCGRRTVGRALCAAGVAVAGPAERADVDVYVLAETVKPEDSQALAGSERPTVVVLNKADLAGFGGDGPIATAAARCRVLGEFIGAQVYPLAGLAAVAALDAAVIDSEVIEALRTLSADPADLGSTDRFVAGPHRVAPAVRRRLLEQLDLFGIAHAVHALRDGNPSQGQAAVRAAVRRASAVDAVLAAITAVAAPVRYRRLTEALAALATAAAGDSDVAEFLAGDQVVAARMAAAAEVVQATGMTVDHDQTRAAHLRRAVSWQRYSRGPVSALQGSCGADLARGSLRLWERAGGVAETRI
ncbi:hypothetical protein BayCH28_04565 [Mycolicibacterium sp. CH28]|nr:hypothetical protein BayCH28_04565 [Mycolicibacterium sp. CH28]